MESLNPGLLQTSCFSTGFANGHYYIQVSSALNSVGLVWWSQNGGREMYPFLHFIPYRDQ